MVEDPKNTGTTVIFDYFDSACHRPQSKRLWRVGVTHYCIAELRETGAGTQQRAATFSNTGLGFRKFCSRMPHRLQHNSLRFNSVVVEDVS